MRPLAPGQRQVRMAINQNVIRRQRRKLLGMITVTVGQKNRLSGKSACCHGAIIGNMSSI